MSRPGPIAVAVIVVALVVTSLGAGLGGAAPAGPEPAALQTSDVETDAVVLEADVAEDGDAAWTIEYRIRLDDENTTAAFESLQQDVRNNSTVYRDQFATRMRTTVGAAENATGREMAVSNVTVSTSVNSFGNRYGVVSYQFLWEGFAGTDDDRLVVGDALAGFFLDEDTSLSVSWPEGYELRSVDPPADETGSRSVTWTGPNEFTTDQPRVVAAPASPLPVPIPVAASVLLVAAVVVGGGVWFSRRDADHEAGPGDGGRPTRAGDAAAGAGDAAARADNRAPLSADGAAAAAGGAASAGSGGSDGETSGETGPGRTGAGASDGEAGEQPAAAEESGTAAKSGTAGGSGTAGESGPSGETEAGGRAGASSAAGAGEESTATETPPELLSPEERVMRLLHERGGRMKQKTVTEELDWSAARTSQVVGSLRDDGKLESFRLGRENVLRLPDEGIEP